MSCIRSRLPGAISKPGFDPLVRDHPTLKAWLSRSGGAYDIATFKKRSAELDNGMEY
jgi:hypothetical protein